MNLISGKEALIALANGEEVEFANSSLGCIRNNWLPVHSYQWSVADIKDQASENNGGECRFRLKPHTITLNGIEVPAPFEPKNGEKYFFLSSNGYGYDGTTLNNDDLDEEYLMFGAWRTEEEIKQVVNALRKVFKEPQQ